MPIRIPIIMPIMPITMPIMPMNEAYYAYYYDHIMPITVIILCK